jgi:hypothetical protein
MRFAVLSESPADESALRVLLEPLVNAGETAEIGQLRSRGWPAVLNVLPTVIKQLHYHETVDGLVVVADSDRSTPHGAHSLDEPDDCRLCRLTSRAMHEVGALTPVLGRPTLKVAVGLCIPAIEAWYLCGIDNNVTEAAWINGLREGRLPYTRTALKARVYGTPLPQLDGQKAIAVLHGTRLAAELNLLDTWFPGGCGTMLNSVRLWTGSDD